MEIAVENSGQGHKLCAVKATEHANPKGDQHQKCVKQRNQQVCDARTKPEIRSSRTLRSKSADPARKLVSDQSEKPGETKIQRNKKANDVTPKSQNGKDAPPPSLTSVESTRRRSDLPTRVKRSASLTSTVRAEARDDSKEKQKQFSKMEIKCDQLERPLLSNIILCRDETEKVLDTTKEEQRKLDKESTKISSNIPTRTKTSKARRKLFQMSSSSKPEAGRHSTTVSPAISEIVLDDNESDQSVENLRTVNLDLRDQVSKLRYQMEAQKGKLKHILWQKVLDIRKIRQLEQKKLMEALNDQRDKLERERSRDLESLRGQLTIKAESDLQKYARHKDTEINKLRMELASKENMLQRLLGDNRHARLKLNIDDRKSKLVYEIKALRRQKKELEDSLSSASSAERAFSDDIRRHSQSFELEISRVKRQSQFETNQLIEQLKNKDKLISQLEKDLGQQWVAAQLAALERESSEGARSPTMSAPSHTLGVLPEDSVDPTTYFRTPTSASKPGGVEDGRSTGVNEYTIGKQDLPKKLKDLKARNKELVDKCRAYLHRTKELTAQNRAYKDSSDKMLHENKKMQELIEHSKLRVLQLTRQMSEQVLEKNSGPAQSVMVEELKKEMMEDKKTIQALRQACSEKDRRIELIQHRKRRRRVVAPANMNLGIRETIFGYDEDKSIDSDASISSISHSTVSEEDSWDHVISMEETERGYQRLMMEQLQVQRSHALLQKQVGNNQDPQREIMAKITLQNDLFQAQCRIEKLEQLINEIGEGEVLMLLKERETILSSNKEAAEKAIFWEQQSRQLQQELNKALEKSEDLEFQLMEMENYDETKQSASCHQECQCTHEVDHELIETLAHCLHQSEQDMEQLRKEIAALVKGREGDALLKQFDKVRENEKKHAESMESLAHELQVKVISLQKEKDTLQEKLSLKGHKPVKGDNSASIAREKQENLELKAELTQLINSENKLLEERIQLQEELNDWKTQYEYLKQQLDIFTQTQTPKQKIVLKRENSSNESSSPSSSPATSSLSRRPSKDRKSKPRSGDDPTQSKRRKSSPENSSDFNQELMTQSSMQSFQSLENLHGMSDSVSEVDVLKLQLKALQSDWHSMREENLNLKDQLRQSALEKSSEAEADQQLLLDKVEMLKSELELMRRENISLSGKLKQRIDEFHDSQDELNPRLAELEDYCEDLQERLHASEMTERQLKEKLRLVEGSIDEAESNEMALRERYEQLMLWEVEAKKQIRELQKNGHELKEIVLDKDFVEQALREKVDFLQKCEAASIRRIEELEAIERDLREQLETKSDPKCQRELNKIQELKHQITFLETDNKALAARISELEENEEILRENWRRVADEDYNRTQTLQEKVKMLESMNRDLKAKLAEAQEYFVINVSPNENSLAAELAQSQSSLRDAVLESTAPGGGDRPTAGVDGAPVDQEKLKLMDKLKKLKRQLSDVAEKKDSKIETLQEKIVSLKETEVKLSETISEMEMTERELRAKLALYESSEVTVEKMLKYQSKIEELRTSQESLLDQLESLENQEMTLQEKMQEMERTLRGKIVTLEVEMKGYKQKELKSAGRIRELEKQEKELSEKVAQQAEKENGLYVKISSLMDEVKSAKEEVESLKNQMASKEDKVRKAKLLEVKLLEIEMEYGKKISDISSKLRHKEEELRQKEATHEEEVTTLQNEVATLQSALNTKESEKNRRIAILEKLFAQKENDFLSKIAMLEENIKELTNEKTMHQNQIKELQRQKSDLENKDYGYKQEMDILREEVISIKTSETEYEDKIVNLERNCRQEKQRADEAEFKVSKLEKDLAKEKKKVADIEVKLIAMKGDIEQQMKTIEANFVEKESDYEKELDSLQEEVEKKDVRVKELETELEKRARRVSELESECSKLKSKAANEDQETIAQIKMLEKEKSELFTRWSAKQQSENSELAALKSDKEGHIEDLKKKNNFLSTQLLHEAATREQLETSIDDFKNKEKTLVSRLNEFNKEIEHLKEELLNKLKELDAKNKEMCELNLEISHLRYSNKTLQSDYQHLKEQLHQNEKEIMKQISEKDEKLQHLQSEIKILKEELSQKNILILKASENKKRLQEKESELFKLVEEKSQKDIMVQETIQKSEHMLLLSQKEKDSAAIQVENLRKDLQSKEVVVSQHLLAIEEKNKEIQGLNSMLDELKESVKQKSLDTEKYQKDLSNSKKEQEKSLLEINQLKKQIEEKQSEVELKSSEQTNTQLVISAKQHELEQAKLELHKCLEEIQEFKKLRDQDKDQQQEQDQAYRKLSADFEQLTLQYDEHIVEHKHLEFKVADVELKLVEAENRYRELEAKCASLEVQLAERFAHSQQAEKIIKLKEDEVAKLETKLEELEKELEETSTQKNETERIIILKDKEFKVMKSKLETVGKEYDDLKVVVKNKNEESQKLKDELTSLKKKNDLLKEEADQLQQSSDNYHKENKESQSELAELKMQVSQLQKKWEDANNNLKASDDFLMQADQSFKSLEQKCKETETQLKGKELLVEELEQTMKTKNHAIDCLEMKLKDNEKKCVDLNLHLTKAEKDFQGKCSELTSVQSMFDKAEFKLKSCEERCDQLKEKLNTAEMELQEVRHINQSLTQKLSILEGAVKEKESFCRDSQSDFESLQQQHLEVKIECENLKSKLNYFQQMFEHAQNTCKEKEEHIITLETSLKQSQSSLQEQQEKLQDKETCYNERVSQLEQLQKDLKSSQEERTLLESQIQTVGVELEQVNEEKKSLKNQMEQHLLELNKSKEKCDKLQVEIQNVQSKYEEQNIEIKHFKDKCQHLELECQKIKQEKELQAHSLRTTESSQQDLLTSIQKLELENKTLKLKLNEQEEIVNSKDDGFSELVETNQLLSGKLYRLEAAAVESETKYMQLEQSKAELLAQKDKALKDAEKLQVNLKDFSEECESLKAKLENSQLKVKELEESNAHIQSNDKNKEEIAKQQQHLLEQQLQQCTSEMETKLTTAQELNDELNKVVYHLKKKVHQLEEEKLSLTSKLHEAETQIQAMTGTLSDLQIDLQHLQAENVKLKVSVAESEKESSKLLQANYESNEGVKESNITVSLVSELQTMPPSGISKEQELAEKLHSLEIHHEETLHKMEKLLKDIESYKSRDQFSQEKIKGLDKNLKEMREREKKMSEKVADMEVKEKQLLEQMADIETSVIVPLETENQELKDELNVVKQERDDAQAKASKGNDEDMLDGVNLHKSLEDALIQRDELEKKINILAEEISSIEEEKKNLKKQVADANITEGELIDKIEFLEDEVERLKNIEHQKSVLEEHLMDRLLDLEEREKKLQEKLLLKNKSVTTQCVQTDAVDGALEDMVKQYDFLKQKNEVLQDAESKYMDKILDLEEINNKLQNEVEHLKASANVAISKELGNASSHEENGASRKNLMASKYTDTFDLLLPSEQTVNSEHLSERLVQLEHQNKSFAMECEDKASKIKYLEEKIVLLQDSEAKLMEKLTEDISTLPCAANTEELQKKIDNLMEENDFLAQSIESYKKLYKDEKEKCNELQDRIMEESSLYQELQEAHARLGASEAMVEEVQAEYEEQLSERENQLEHFNKLLNVSQLRENELQGEVNALKDYLNTLPGQRSKDPSVQSLKEDLEQQIADLSRHHEVREQDLRKQLELLQAQEQESKNQHQQQVLKLEHYIQDLRHHELELLKQVDLLKQHEKALVEEANRLRKTEKQLQSKVDSLEAQLRMKEDDSGLSSDDQRVRSDNLKKSVPQQSPTPVSEVFSSKVTLTLAKSPTTKSPAPPAGQYAESRDSTPPPLTSPLRSRPSQASLTHNELVHLVAELQASEADLKNRLQELQASHGSDLSKRVEELEVINQNLQRKLRFSESKRTFQASPSPDKQPRLLYHGGDKNNNNNTAEYPSGGQDISQTMLDKPEHILMQRIKDLETVEKHNKTQLSELERDREVLHEIARKDKATIHDLQIKIRELQLSERGLKEQISNLELSEGSLCTKCENLEVTRQQLEDRVHELEIHERRLRELVRRLKLNEEHWLSKSGGMENAVAELSATELQLKRHLQDIEMEKGGLSERAEYLEARVRELENVELSLLQRLKSYEINEANLKNRLGHLENSEAAAHSKAYELDVLNVDLSQRLQKAVEECSMLSQHILQLQGQVQELDRRLLSAKDSEMAYKQHVETLEKNENLVQKKVREFELREIDSQARIRELEQTVEILNDKIAALQRSENRLKFRIQELEEITSQDSQARDKALKHTVPQKLEDCQKYIIVLQQQVENLQQHFSSSSNTSKAGEGESVSVSLDQYNMFQRQNVLLEETLYQLQEVEREKEQLSVTILQLRQGKGACGHEVEIEVLKKRLLSYKTLFNKLKFSLSAGQATSLLDSEQDSDPLGDTLPARHLHELEPERVLQSIRGFQDGKAEIIDAHQDDSLQRDVVQTTVKGILLSQAAQAKSEQPSYQEESHWRAIEARKPKEIMSGSWGGAIDMVVGGVKQALPRHLDGSKQSSTPELEEVTVAFHLQSESELSSHHKTQNDTDSSDGPVPPPRRGRIHRVGKSSNYKNNSGHDSSGSRSTDVDCATMSTVAANKKHYFGNEKSLPSSANAKRNGQQTKPAPLTSFGEDSFYLPSSTQEGADSLDDGEAPPLPSSAPPGRSPTHVRQERKDSLDDSTSGMSIRERIALIEKQLQTDQSGNKSDPDQVFYWKKKSSENLRQVEVLEKDNKYLKEDINRLEKELEDKRRYINLLEIWLSNLDDLLKNKNKQTDREMLEYLQLDLTKLRHELSHIGYRREDCILDAAALKTELEHRDKEIVSKRNEIESLVQKLRLSQEECQTIEGMRRNALDSLRSLEKEVIDLQEAETQLQNAQAELQTLKQEFEIKCKELNDALAERKEFEMTLEKTIAERDRLICELKSLEEMNDKLISELKSSEEMKSSLKKEINELNMKMEEISSTESRNSSLAGHINKLNDLLATRTEKMQEVYKENLQLRERSHQTETELIRLRNLCDDYNNLSARFDELDNSKNQATILLQSLQAKVERLARKCQEKDILLRRLGADLRRTSYRPSSALEELTRLEHVMAQEEYNIDFPVNGRSPQRPARNKRSSSLDDLDYNYASSDTDSISFVPIASSRTKRPPPYMDNRPRSADNFTPRARGSQSRSSPVSRRVEVHQRMETNLGQFIAIADYDPAIFSQSGRPGLELELREGDAVLITGPMDRTGYYEAEVKGRTGLVPANYLQPLNGSSHMMNYGINPRVSPTHSEQAFNKHRQVHAMSRDIVSTNYKVDSSHNGQVRSRVPDPPQNLHIKGLVNDRGLLLSWLPPKVDARCSTHGFQLLGYMVFVNNQPYEQIPNPNICEFLIEDLNLGKSVHLAVQSLCAGGHVSPKAELVFEGIIKVANAKGGIQVEDQKDLDTDLSSVLSSVHYKRGHRKAVMALYDYNPKQQSPHDYTAFELAFQAGDVIHVYGDPRPDGFFHGEVDGNRGLVPACFVEDLSKIDKSGLKVTKEVAQVK
ncbi:golgin subfamily B member 1-like isoform X2 [Biomphalaria glabrata]|uniref:Golgin subfamily B member 1-like isoform X2 n=1 Tax=Biomphalaria glabrata TaxID=6526 RepID=A0A9W3A668_BIOGL|nr:golgin subfamily B member 1-like isoform X2 [Biomphalaria glabrata]